MRPAAGPAPTYGTPGFDAASELVRTALEQHDRPLGVVRTFAMRPRATLRAARIVSTLPRVDVRLSDSPAGAVIRQQLDKRAMGLPVGRLARAALLLPDDPADYYRGKARQALRTNLNRAGEAGIVCRRLDPGEELDRRSVALDRARGWDPRTTTPAVPEREFVLAEDPEGRTLGISVAIADVECAYLAYLIASEPSGAAGLARYALSAELVERLIERRVRILLVEGTLWASPGVQYFQRRLGFLPYNVRVRRGPPRPR